MVWSCGMNGRSRESRPSASGGQTSKKNLSTQNQRAAHKPKASAEALQMARILEDASQISELNSKVAAVQTVVPECTEEQIHLALHDNNYDLDKTISALLDSDGISNQGEWTTTTSSRKARKKGTNTEEQSKTSTGRTSSRSASGGMRESYGGGGVMVSGGSAPLGRTGQRQTTGRGRGQSTGKRVRSGASMGSDQRRTRQRDKDKSHSTAQGTAPNKSSSEEWDTLPKVTAEQKDRSSEDWGREGEIWEQATLNEHISKLWEPVQQPRETALQQHQREIILGESQDTSLEQSRDISLERPDPATLEDPSDFGQQGLVEQGADEKSESNSVFPEAIPGGPALLHSTRSEITPAALVNTGGGGERGHPLTHIPSESREKVITRKPRRLARSQIPTKPVEMPAGIESLDVQFGELGIDFVGLESQSPPPEQASEGAVSSHSASPSISAPEPNTSVDTAVPGLIPYSELQQRYGEGSVSVSMSTSSSNTVGLGGEGGGALLQLDPSPYSEQGIASEEASSSSGGGSLRSPPGLPHPVAATVPASTSSSETQYGSSGSLPRTAISTEQATPVAVSGGGEVGGATTSQQQSPSAGQLHLHSDVSPSPTLKPTGMELPMELTTRQNQPSTQTTTPIEASFSSVASSGSDKFSSSATASASVSSLNSSVSSRAVSVSGGSSLSSQHHQQHHQTHQQQQGKLSGSSVPPGMLYPHMMPAQYPFIPAVNPAMYNYDPNDISRYSSGSMAYFPTSSDPSLGGAIPSREHSTSAFQAQSEQAKYVPPRGGGSDLGSAVAVSSNQQTQQQGGNLQQAAAAAASGAQQMGPPFMGTHFYGSMFYPTMYGPMPAFSQAANFGMSYEEMIAAASAPASHDYSKMYGGTGSSLSKQPSSTSTAPIDSSALAAQSSSSFKHLDSSKSFNYSVPGGVGGSQPPATAPGYYMQMPFPHMMVGPGGDVGGVAGGVAPHSRISQQKHSSKVGGGVSYQGNSGTSYWGSTAAHSS